MKRVIITFLLGMTVIRGRQGSIYTSSMRSRPTVRNGLRWGAVTMGLIITVLMAMTVMKSQPLTTYRGKSSRRRRIVTTYRGKSLREIREITGRRGRL